MATSMKASNDSCTAKSGEVDDGVHSGVGEVVELKAGSCTFIHLAFGSMLTFTCGRAEAFLSIHNPVADCGSDVNMGGLF